MFFCFVLADPIYVGRYTIERWKREQRERIISDLWKNFHPIMDDEPDIYIYI